ncbi:MAG: 4-hydroxyproline epimerase [Pirellulaceae bacterium]|nr:MAG: 4-hydroxyproline epimerase [Pirellulaceae bacterium]
MAREYLRIVDSHTAGEATRVVCQGGPYWKDEPPMVWREKLRNDFDHYRRAMVWEPRGHPAVVGAWLGPPHSPGSLASVVFFNNTGYLSMCVHGTIGVAVTMRYLRRVEAATFRLDTPAGPVQVEVHSDNEVSVTNVPSYCHQTDIAIDVPEYGRLAGDVAWGGNWFYLVHEHGEQVVPENIPRLTWLARRVRSALGHLGVRGAGGAEIDHVELFGPPSDPACHSRNFVLCPGGEYDRSPCGTGTSAKIACLAHREQLAPGAVWRQQGILGTWFDGWYRWEDGRVIPTIRGSAYITADATLILDVKDPFRYGIG